MKTGSSPRYRIRGMEPCSSRSADVLADPASGTRAAAGARPAASDLRGMETALSLLLPMQEPRGLDRAPADACVSSRAGVVGSTIQTLGFTREGVAAGAARGAAATDSIA